jgi:hypothetical protein
LLSSCCIGGLGSLEWAVSASGWRASGRLNRRARGRGEGEGHDDALVGLWHVALESLVLRGLRYESKNFLR